MVDDFSKIWEFVIGLPLWALVIISLLSFLYLALSQQMVDF